MSRQRLQAVILAAGRGERLRPLTDSTPKSLVSLAGLPVLGRTLAALEAAGVPDVTIVTGYRERQVRAYVEREFAHLRVRCARNPVYARTNTLYSLWIARRAVRCRPFLLIDGDLVFDPALLRRVLARPGNILVCDAKMKPDSEAVKAYGQRDGRVVRIGKTTDHALPLLGESIGLAKIEASTSCALFDGCRTLLRERGVRHYYEAAFQRLIGRGFAFRASQVGTAKWAEIDTKSDLRRARALFQR